MTRITETQALVLSNAAARDPGFILPLPEGCRAKGGAALKVVAGLVGRGWAQAIKGRHFRQLPEGAVPWKTDDAGEPLYPVITHAGLQAIGVEADDAEPVEAAAAAEPPEVAQEPARRTSRAASLARRRLAAAKNALEAVCSHWAETGRLDEALLGSCRATMAELQRADAELAAEAPAPGAGGEPRAGTKQARLIEMLRRPEGATIAQIAESSGWQSHTVRGVIAGALKRKLGLTVTSDKPENGGDRVYRLHD